MGSLQADWPYIINLGNSIIGVSVLAMPFCFKQCGVVLGTLLLLLSAGITNISCGFLVRTAITTRKRTYEFMALHTFGPAGKFLVEISIIGLLIGTCVAFFVIIGDLGPVIISKVLGIENSSALRTSLMLFLAIFVALPLGMLRRVESLSNISAMSIGFYIVFVIQVFTAAFPNLWSGVWVTKVTYWNPDGVFKCLPIFSLAFSCQTTLFVMYDALPDPSMKRMSHITKGAIGLCTSVYLMVGYFGYVAFCDDEISGDVLLNFRPTIISEAVKFGFVLSVAISFPLVIFPCRASIYMLLFARPHSKPDLGGSTILPEFHSRVITVAVVFITLLIGILVPNVEFVLAMTGATMGSLICFIFPATMFIHIMSMPNTGGKSTAQFILFLGVTILLASTYVTITTPRPEPIDSESIVKIADHDGIPSDEQIDDLAQSVDLKADGDDVKKEEDWIKEDPGGQDNKEENIESEKAEVKDDQRQEPPIPHAPLEDEEKESQKVEKIKTTSPVLEQREEMKEQEKNEDNNFDEEKDKEKSVDKDTDKDQEEVDADKEEDKEDKENETPEKSLSEDKKDHIQDTEKDIKAEIPENEEAKLILEELKDQQKQQQQLIDQQKQIIEDLKQHQQEAHAKEAELEQKEKHLEQEAEKPAQLNEKDVPYVVENIQQPQPLQEQQPVQQQQQQQQPIQQQQQLVQQPVIQQQQPIQQQAIQQQPIQAQPAQQQPIQQQNILQQQPIQQSLQQQALQQNQPVQQQPIIQQEQLIQQPVQQQPDSQQQQVPLQQEQGQLGQQQVYQQPLIQQQQIEPVAQNQPPAQQPQQIVLKEQDQHTKPQETVLQQQRQIDKMANQPDNLDQSIAGKILAEQQQLKVDHLQKR